ncbi:hypothetical protein D3C86_1149320 [compost metagenome]
MAMAGMRAMLKVPDVMSAAACWWPVGDLEPRASVRPWMSPMTWPWTLAAKLAAQARRVRPRPKGVTARVASSSAKVSSNVASSTTPIRSVVAGGLVKPASPKVMASVSKVVRVMSTACSSMAAAAFCMIGSAWVQTANRTLLAK